LHCLFLWLLSWLTQRSNSFYLFSTSKIFTRGWIQLWHIVRTLINVNNKKCLDIKNIYWTSIMCQVFEVSRRWWIKKLPVLMELGSNRINQPPNNLNYIFLGEEN
jgi:hypothetical protein